jgi:hypothetical protein
MYVLYILKIYQMYNLYLFDMYIHCYVLCNLTFIRIPDADPMMDRKILD